jgi:hypothetical protein
MANKARNTNSSNNARNSNNLPVAILGQSTEWIAKSSHLMTQLDWAIIQEIASRFECIPGIWGQLPLEGELEHPDLLSPIAGEVSMSVWETLNNQSYASDVWPSLGRNTFSMAIDCSVDISRTEKLWPPGERNLTDFQGLLRRVPLILEDLRWLAIPISEIVEISLIIVAPGLEESLSALENYLKQTRQPTARLCILSDSTIGWEDHGLVVATET